MHAPFLILQTGEPVPELRRHRGFPHWIRVSGEIPRDGTDVINVANGEPLPERVPYAGIFVTGSPAMVTDRQAWSESTAEWLRGRIAAGIPTLGICYGHQLIAHALGGTVDNNPAGREIGTVEITRSMTEEDPLMQGMPAQFPAHASHMQSVIHLPDDAVVLARSALEPHQAVRYAPNCWGLQFHPEFSTQITRTYVKARAARIQEEGGDVDSLLGTIRSTPEARGLLRRFVRIAHQRLLGKT